MKCVAVQEGLPGIGPSRRIIPNRIHKVHPSLTPGDRQKVAVEIHRRAIALGDSNYDEQQKRAAQLHLEAERFCQCGTRRRRYHCDYDNEDFFVNITCHSRICERCGRRYYYTLRDSMNSAIAPLFSQKRKGYGLFLLTLTVTTRRYNDQLPSAEGVRRVYRESAEFFKLFYGKFMARRTPAGKVIEDASRFYWTTDTNGHRVKRRRKTWTRFTKNGDAVDDYRRYRGAGFMATMELGENNNNLHIHALVYGPYISQRRLSAEWLKITGDSMVVDIKPVKTPKEAIWYVVKYIVKPPACDSYGALAAYTEMIKGTRRLRTGGVLFNRVHARKLQKLTFCCPYCQGWLRGTGEYDCTDSDADTAAELFPLLKKARDGPLLNPGGTTPWTRDLDQLQGASCEKDVTWLEIPYSLN